MRRLSDHETECLIELWHVEEFLWKVTDSRYANCRKAALERISKDMDGIDVSDNTMYRTFISRTRMWANAQRDGALPDIGGVLCSTQQSLADSHY